MKFGLLNLIVKTIYETLTSPTSPDEPQIIKFGNSILHDRGVIPQLRRAVLVVASPDGDQGPVEDLAQCYHLEAARERLVRAPVLWQH